MPCPPPLRPRGSSRGAAGGVEKAAARPAHAHWWPRQGRGDVTDPPTLARPRLRTRRPPPTSLASSRRSMLRAAALAAAGLGPRLGRRLLSAAAIQGVPAPNQQPQVIYNQVRPPAWPGSVGALFFPGDGARWVRRPCASLCLNLPSRGLRGSPPFICTHRLFLP